MGENIKIYVKERGLVGLNWIDRIKIRTSDRIFKHSNKYSGSQNMGKFSTR